ncbi:MAG TPA: carboxylesterase family protein, partial [Sinorhizobium sp.]|nr:carboxylesterase family protein [Sinorhizobium sp.]
MTSETRHTGRRTFLKQGAMIAAATRVAAAAAAGKPSPVVETHYGRLRGMTDGGVHRFLGIRYGAETSGKNRFQPPAKPPSWSGVRDANVWGHVAPQPLPTGGIDYTHSVQWMNPPGGEGEDCLVLNVWTPGIADGRKRAVLFSIHGGGYSSGSGSNPAFNGQPLAQHGDVVVVAINHRLGSLGYLHLGDIVPEWSSSGVVGMLDIVAALEWVRDNIENFGGDPGNVMIFGQSGGGGKVSHLMAMPAAKGLFHRAAIQSGATLRSGDSSDAHAVTERMLGQIGLSTGRVRELQSIPWQMMIGAQMTVGGRLGPIVDGKSIPRHPFDPDAPALSADVPLLVGTCLHDGAYRLENLEMDENALASEVKEMFGADGDRILRAYRASYPGTKPSLLLAQISSDRGLRRNAITLSERKAALGAAPVYMYRFDWPSQSFGGKYGAVHGVDVPLSFRNVDAWPLTGTSAQARNMAERMAAAWLAFAKTGNPRGEGLPEWPSYNPARRSTMIFDLDTRVENDPDVELLKL